ncbi:MAG: hypothetical protein ABIK32_00945 [Chloroflexota bacterium]|nr:hypothetical protein [Chloroflexota bacterium]
MNVVLSYIWKIVGNIEFVQQLVTGLIFFIPAVILIPLILKWLQTRREKRLVKALLRKWGGSCVDAIERLNPVGNGIIEIEGLGRSLLVWKKIREGRKEPEGIAIIVGKAFEKVLCSEEEWTAKVTPPDVKYPFQSGDPDVPRSWIKQMLNLMYSKLEIFDLDLLPISELELAMSTLETFSQLGHITRDGFAVYSLRLAQAMEKFGKYLWKIEKWPK